MYSTSFTGWENFFVASAGAAAAVAGLLFVVLSINLAPILKGPGFASRAGETFIPVAVTLIISLLALVPGHAIKVFGVEPIIIGGSVWMVSSLTQIRAFRALHFKRLWHFVFRLLVNEPANLAIIVAGFSLVTGFPGVLYWLFPAIILAFTGTMANAWVLPAEILR